MHHNLQLLFYLHTHTNNKAQITTTFAFLSDEKVLLQVHIMHSTLTTKISS